MSLLTRLFGEKKKTAAIAKERLQLIIAREHIDGKSSPDFLPALQKELLGVISKYVKIAPEDIKVQLERQDNIEILEVNIVLSETASPPAPQ